MNSFRSHELITDADLRRLRLLTAEAWSKFFVRNAQTASLYSERILCSALCQGAALHFVDQTNGVKDFDVWTFFAARAQRPFPYRWRGEIDFVDPKFGKSPDRPDFIGKKIDLIGRSISYLPADDPADAVRRWLAAKSTSAKELARKAVVLIDPELRLGEVVWPR